MSPPTTITLPETRGNPVLREDLFLAVAKENFWRRQGAEREAYEALLYALHPPAPQPLMQRMSGFRASAPAVGLGKEDAYRAVAGIMRRVRYPDTEMLLQARNVEGLDLQGLSAILHFHHPAYPIYSKRAVESLNKMGHPILWHAAIDDEGVGAYAGFIAAIDRLKLRMHYTEVPESNCFLTRVVEAALMEY